MKAIFTITISLISSIIFAENLTVTSLEDSGTGSLRELVDNASDDDTIRFDKTLLNESNDTIYLTSGQIYTNKSISIIGLHYEEKKIVISGSDNSRIFCFYNAGNISLDSLILINGNGKGTNSNGYGGAIHFQNSDSLFISNCSITDNYADLGNGGGISVLSNSSNKTSYTRISNSTVSNNSAYYNGGGVCAISTSGYPTSEATIEIINSTVYNNDANGDGGGVYSWASASSYPAHSKIEIINSTIFKNTAGSTGDGVKSRVNSSDSKTSSIEVISSIIGFNGNENIANTLSPIINSGGYNIFEDNYSETISSDQINVSESDLNLSTLSDNGGIVLGLLPQEPSVAIDKGNPNDNSAAKNNEIKNIRDVGASESPFTVLGIPRYNIMDIKIYPNPTIDQLIINIPNKEFTNGEFTLHNSQGDLILTGKLKKPISEINVRNFNSGTYILTIESGLYTTVKKVIIK